MSDNADSRWSGLYMGEDFSDCTGRVLIRTGDHIVSDGPGDCRVLRPNVFQSQHNPFHPDNNPPE